MKKLSTVLIVLFLIASTQAQKTKIGSSGRRPAPEMSVSGVKLNDEASGRAFLAGYSFRRDEANRPVYYFYDKHETQVLAFTAHSPERRFLIVAAEIFRVGAEYKKTYYVLEDVPFQSESGFFVGDRPSAASLIFGVSNRVDVGKLIARKGAPDERRKNGKIETVGYTFTASPAGDVPAGAYKAEYVFVGGKLNKFKIETTLSPQIRRQ